MMASPIITVVLMLGSVIGLQFGIAHYRNSGIGVALLLLMTGLLGWLLGPLLNVALSMRNGMQLVGYAAVGTGVIFFGMGAIATTTKRDFSFMGKFLFVGMIALLVAMLANMFLQIPALALTISTLVIVVFSLFLLYDLQPHRPRRRDQLRDGHDRRVHQPAQHLLEPAAAPARAERRSRLALAGTAGTRRAP